MIGIIDCDIQIYAMIEHLVPINKYQNNIIHSDDYWYYKINYLFPNLPIPKNMKPYAFYQHIQIGGCVKIDNIIKYAFTINDDLLYEWLLKYHEDLYWSHLLNYQSQFFGWNNNNITNIDGLFSLYLLHYDIICYKNKKHIIANNIHVFSTYRKYTDLMRECIKKYDVKIDDL